MAPGVEFFDSSVLVSLMAEGDADHEASLRAWHRANRRAIYAHGLLEVFSVLTGGRHSARLSPKECFKIISHNLADDSVDTVQFSASEIPAAYQGGTFA